MSILKNKITTKRISAKNSSQDEISYRKRNNIYQYKKMNEIKKIACHKVLLTAL